MASTLAAADESQPWLEDYHRQGFAVVRGVFSKAEIAELARAFDRIYAIGMGHPRSFRHGNCFYRQGNDAALGRILRFMQWPSYFDEVLDGFRRDSRLVSILSPLIGTDLKQIINQMHWKPPGAAGAEFGYHQDIRFRRPRQAYRDPATSYVQTGIAVDPHRLENGAMLMCSGSHRLGELTLGDGQVMNRSLDDDDLRRAGLDPRQMVPLELDPGDVALWHLYTVHGSGRNRTRQDRRLYINGYVRSDNCDRGEWTFRKGKSINLGDPVLVHYEQLFDRPEPHYVDD